jgi:hypothetical protein
VREGTEKGGEIDDPEEGGGKKWQDLSKRFGFGNKWRKRRDKERKMRLKRSGVRSHAEKPKNKRTFSTLSHGLFFLLPRRKIYIINTLLYTINNNKNCTCKPPKPLLGMEALFARMQIPSASVPWHN